MKASKEEKRKLIIDAATKVFSQKGYHKTRMEEIAALAGIGKGTIYEYFTSKIQLFQAMIEQGFGVYYNKLNVEEVQSLPFDEWLRVITEAHARFCLDNIELAKVLFMEKAEPDMELLQWAIDTRTEKLNAMREMLEKRMERKEIRLTDPQLLVYIIQASMTSFYMPILIEGREIDPAYFARRYADIMMNGLKAGSG